MAQKSMDYGLCLICKTKKDGEQLVENPVSHGKVLNSVKEWASYGDVRYYDLSSKLEGIPFEEIQSNASWHRSCYQDTVHTNKLKRAKER